MSSQSNLSPHHENLIDTLVEVNFDLPNKKRMIYEVSTPPSTSKKKHLRSTNSVRAARSLILSDVDENLVDVPINIDVTLFNFYANTDYIKNVEISNFGIPTCTCPFCGAPFWREEAIKGIAKKALPEFNRCCNKGLINLPPPPPPPSYLSYLLNPEINPKYSRFMDNIRLYNSMFSFTSTGAKVDHGLNQTPGPYIFKISGQNHHFMGSLVPLPNEPPKFAQLYVYDTKNETSNRLSHFNTESTRKTLDPEIVENLIRMFDEHNVLTKAFRMVRDRFSANYSESLKLRLVGRCQPNSRQYELPTIDELAMLIVGDFEHYDNARDIIAETHKKELKRINILHPNLMSLQYPVLFPHGGFGFTETMPYSISPLQKKLKRQFITMREYYAYCLYTQNVSNSIVLRAGRLFQQYIVDAYSCVEQARLDYLRRNQKSLRSEIYSGIRDAFYQGDSDGTQIGKKIILPSTYTGGPRYMMEHYQDAMAICRCYGNPNFFMTFTCNPLWSEISDTVGLTSNMKVENRPDVVSRVFKMKVDSLMDDLKKKQIFGKINALLYTVEFQKRGLPHIHCLIWLQHRQHPMSPMEIDEVITAQMPNPKIDPVGFKVVTKFMIHGPCGAVNPKCPCMKNNKCSKFFPKKFQQSTSIDSHGFVTYKREDNNIVFERNGLRIDNRFVVPHNRDLVVRYQAHLNIEACCYSTMVKYLFKYITKGVDRVNVVIEKENSNGVAQDNTTKITKDEIKNYLDCRYISPSEACWRLFEFPIHHREPSVERLCIHLPNQNVVMYEEHVSLSSVLHNPRSHKTMLTEWMVANKINIHARELTYIEFPTKWIWENKDKIWVMRKKGMAIGRISYVHPSSRELFYLRMLLNFVKGVRSFEEIRTVNGVIHPDFQTTCGAYGLLESDNEWHDALKQASFTASAKQLRNLFVIIILFCNVGDPVKLLDSFYSNFSEDIEYEIRQRLSLPINFSTSTHVRNYVLIELEKHFNRNGHSLSDFSLPMPLSCSDNLIQNRLIQEELAYDIFKLHSDHERMVTSLNSEQKTIYDAVVDTVSCGKSNCFFLYGHGGTGKTYVYETIIAKLRSECKIVLVVASSGIAALLLPGGRTAHSRFKIPLELSNSSTCNIKKGTNLANLIKECSLIIWDEAPMCHRYCFETVDRSFKDIHQTPNSEICDLPFGGKPIIFGGDFRQILPVIPNGSKDDILDASITNSYLWKHFTIFKLKTNMRLKENGNTFAHGKYHSFGDWLLAVGDGKVETVPGNPTDNENSWINLPEQLIAPTLDDPNLTITSTTYPSFSDNYKDAIYLQERAIVTPKNETAKQINDYMLNLIPEQEKVYYSCDSLCKTTTNLDELQTLYPIEFLNSINPHGFPSHEISLKLNAPIMLLRNLNPAIGLCNGTRLVIIQLNDRVIEATILTGAFTGNRVFIPRISLNYNDKKYPFVIQRRQFPVRVCYCMTINKSQGQTLKQIGLYLTEPVFTHGQLYVALSRVTTSSHVKIVLEPMSTKPMNECHINDDMTVTTMTKNVVYTEIFKAL